MAQSADQSGVEGDTITMTVTVADHPGLSTLDYQVRLLPGTASPNDYSRNGNGRVNALDHDYQAWARRNARRRSRGF